MSTILKQLTPIAKKVHTCMYCGCNIQIGEKYRRDTLICDGELYDWIAHVDCHAVAIDLNMFDYVDDEGLSGEDFDTNIDQYLYDNYEDKEIEDIPEHIRKMTRIEQVRMIRKDLIKEDKQ